MLPFLSFASALVRMSIHSAATETIRPARIAKASQDQATAVAQVNRGIEQVSQVVQTNSATAEQSAATSEELSGQAELLKEMVSRFDLQAQAAARPTRPAASKPASLPSRPRIGLNGRESGKN